MSSVGRNLAKTLRANGFSPPGVAVMGTGTFRKHGKMGDFAVDEVELRKMSKNIDAFIKTFTPQNLKTVLQANADAIIVPRVRAGIRANSTQNKIHYIYRNGRRTKVHPDNLAKSYQVLWPGRKRIKKSAFVGPKANFKKNIAKTVGTTARNANAIYAPAWEHKYGKVIKRTVNSAAPMYLLANARVIRTMMK